MEAAAKTAGKRENMKQYEETAEQIRRLAQEDAGRMPLLSNASSVLYYGLPDISWAGFYLFAGDRLVLGPFQGKPACIHIPLGKGVCGTAAERKEQIVVDDVRTFPGHIACDSASRSECVTPLVRDGKLLGVLDLDSTKLSRFTDEDAAGLKKVAEVLSLLLEDA